MNTQFRENVISLLKTIASPEMQMEYENNVPIANVPAELVCQWFDDIQPRTEHFENSFSSSEVSELIKFTEFYDARIDSLPNCGSVKKLQTNKEWLEVQRYASELVSKHGW